MKRILFVSFCPRRGNTTGLTGMMIETLSELDKSKYEVSLLDTNYFEKGHRAEDFKVDRYISLPQKPWDGIIKKIPYFRSKYAASLSVSVLRNVLSKTNYNLVALYHIPPHADRYVNLCNKAGVKVLMFPWGGDILCCSDRVKHHIKKAFANTDYVGGAAKSNCIISAKCDYDVPDEKIRTIKNYLPGVKLIEELKGTKSRYQMHEELGIALSDCNIVCCYNGYPTHRHNVILDALIANKSILPKGYQLIFPMTYGASQEYYERIKSRCEENQLNAVFLREFITNNQMAYLHLITDLFINIQDSDCGNAFMIEALYAKNRIITGKWLHYEQFEQYGVPYYLIDNIKSLPIVLKQVFLYPEKRPQVPDALIELYQVPQDYVRGSYWTNIVDTL